MIAIAIPAFGGQLNNAKLAADHANIRNAYAIAQVANLNGGFTKDDGTLNSADGTYYFNKDGSISAANTATDAYELKADGKDGLCDETKYACNPAGSENVHKANKVISIEASSKVYKLTLADKS